MATFSLKVEDTDTISTIKGIIRNKVGIPKAQQRLIFASSDLMDGQTLSDYNINPETTLDLVPHFVKKNITISIEIISVIIMIGVIIMIIVSIRIIVINMIIVIIMIIAIIMIIDIVCVIAICSSFDYYH